MGVRPGRPVRAVSPGLVARPLPDRLVTRAGRRQGGCEPRAGLPLRPAAEVRRLVPAELAGRRDAGLGRAPAPRENPAVGGTAVGGGPPPGEVPLPIVVAPQPGPSGPQAWAPGKRGADFLLSF